MSVFATSVRYFALYVFATFYRRMISLSCTRMYQLRDKFVFVLMVLRSILRCCHEHLARLIAIAAIWLNWLEAF